MDRIDFASFGEGVEDGIEILVDKATVILNWEEVVSTSKVWERLKIVLPELVVVEFQN